MRSDMLRFVQKDFLISVLNEMHENAKLGQKDPNEDPNYWIGYSQATRELINLFDNDDNGNLVNGYDAFVQSVQADIGGTKK